MVLVRWPVVLIGLLWLGCGGSRDPVVEMQRTLASAPSYMIVLDDMREEGTFFTKYYHRYLVTQGDDKQVRTNWIEVPEEVFRKYEPFLGMALAAKSNEGVNATPHPPGYHYVGNPQYGRWENRGGTSFWQFYGQYALMRDLLNWGGNTINRRDLDDYRTARNEQRPFYGSGSNRKWGTQGTITQQQRPSTFERRKQAINRKNQSFTDKLKSRANRSGTSSFGSTSRSRTGFGSRSSGGFGK